MLQSHHGKVSKSVVTAARRFARASRLLPSWLIFGGEARRPPAHWLREPSEDGGLRQSRGAISEYVVRHFDADHLFASLCVVMVFTRRRDETACCGQEHRTLVSSLTTNNQLQPPLSAASSQPRRCLAGLHARGEGCGSLGAASGGISAQSGCCGVDGRTLRMRWKNFPRRHLVQTS